MRIPKYEHLEQDHAETSSDNTLVAVEPLQRYAKPATYYEDGPFDPPSSESDEDESLLEKESPSSPGIAEFGLKSPEQKVRALLWLRRAGGGRAHRLLQWLLT